MSDRVLGRRTFTLGAAWAALSGITISITNCRESSRPSTPDPAGSLPPVPDPVPTPVPLTDETGTFVANHGHVAVIAAAQLMVGGAIRLDIRGTANHPHILELSGPEMAAIANGHAVAKESSEVKGHTHHVTFNAPPAAETA